MTGNPFGGDETVYRYLGAYNDNPVEANSLINLSDYLAYISNTLTSMAGGHVRIAVDPVAHEIKSYNYAKNWGIGPTYDPDFPRFEWIGPYGHSMSVGHFGVVIHLESDSRELGASVLISLQAHLTGTMWIDGLWGDYVYLGAAVYNITELSKFDFPDEFHRSFWPSAIEWSQLYVDHGRDWIEVGDNYYSQTPYNFDHDRYGVAFEAKIGDWLYLEGYYESDIQLSAHAWENIIMEGEIDCENTGMIELVSAQGYEDVMFVAKDFKPNQAMPWIPLLLLEDGSTVPVPGDWSGSADFGTLSFLVNSTSTGIGTFGYNFSDFDCGGVLRNGGTTIGRDPPWPIIDNQLTVEINSDPNFEMTIAGAFEKTGRHASGTWEAVSFGTTCSGTWEASPL